MKKAQPTILLIGNDTTLSYLFGRFAERSGYQLLVNPENLSAKTIADVNSIVIIFLSTELLETNQTLVGELVSFEVPILVCSSVTDEARASELGADYCLLHPLTYDGFQAALVNVSTVKRA